MEEKDSWWNMKESASEWHQLTRNEYLLHVYALTSSHNDEDVEEFCAEAGKVMQKNKSHYKIIIGWF